MKSQNKATQFLVLQVVTNTRTHDKRMPMGLKISLNKVDSKSLRQSPSFLCLLTNTLDNYKPVTALCCIIIGEP